MADDLRAAAERIALKCVMGAIRDGVGGDQRPLGAGLLDALAASPEFLAWAVREACPSWHSSKAGWWYLPREAVAALLGGD